MAAKRGLCNPAQLWRLKTGEMAMLKRVAVLTAVLLAAGCSQRDAAGSLFTEVVAMPPGCTLPVPTGSATTAPIGDASALAVQQVAAGLDTPWGISFLPDGLILVTERIGQLRVIENGLLRAAPVAGVPAVFAEGQGGLFEAQPHPRFAENRLIYLTYAEGTDSANRTTLARAVFDGQSLQDLEVLWQAPPAKEGPAHFGGRMLFLPDDTLILTLGDGFTYREGAQNLDNAFGKIVRLTLEGEPAADNPFIAVTGALPEIWSYGHRNVQGIAYDPSSGRIWTNEHGPRGGDEVNIMCAGGNYGWPVITYGQDYSGAIISPFTEREGMLQPLTYWVPSIAPSGMAFYSGALFPAWQGDLLVSALAGSQLRRVDLDANGARVGEEILLGDIGGRFRHVAQAPDGSIYLLAEATADAVEGQVLRVTPAP
jgi:aldose sugar dehydrogenase